METIEKDSYAEDEEELVVESEAVWATTRDVRTGIVVDADCIAVVVVVVFVVDVNFDGSEARG